MNRKYILNFDKGYIAHPYTVELEKLINIDKESGTRRARSEANKAKALEEYLHRNGLNLDQYRELQHRASQQFYYNDQEIVIPEKQIYGMLVQAADIARSATRIASRDQIRTALTVCGPLHTGKIKADGTFSRFAVVTAGTGAKLSNQRALRENEFIEKFSGELELEFDDRLVDPLRLYDFVSFAGREIGVGASRKLGWGRFTVTAPAA